MYIRMGIPKNPIRKLAMLKEASYMPIKQLFKKRVVPLLLGR